LKQFSCIDNRCRNSSAQTLLIWNVVEYSSAKVKRNSSTRTSPSGGDGMATHSGQASPRQGGGCCSPVVCRWPLLGARSAGALAITLHWSLTVRYCLVCDGGQSVWTLLLLLLLLLLGSVILQNVLAAMLPVCAFCRRCHPIIDVVSVTSSATVLLLIAHLLHVHGEINQSLAILTVTALRFAATKGSHLCAAHCSDEPIWNFFNEYSVMNTIK